MKLEGRGCTEPRSHRCTLAWATERDSISERTQERKQESKKASKQASKKAGKQARKQASEQVSKKQRKKARKKSHLWPHPGPWPWSSPFRATRFRRMAMMALRMSSSSALELTCTSSKSTGTHACLRHGRVREAGPGPPPHLLQEACPGYLSPVATCPDLALTEKGLGPPSLTDGDTLELHNAHCGRTGATFPEPRPVWQDHRPWDARPGLTGRLAMASPSASGHNAPLGTKSSGPPG